MNCTKIIILKIEEVEVLSETSYDKVLKIFNITQDTEAKRAFQPV